MQEGIARSNAVRRVTVLVLLLLVWAVAIFGKLVALQVFSHKRYVASARKQQELKVNLPAVRGNIYDRNGHALAMSISMDSVSINPLNIPDASVAAEVLAQNLNLNQQDLYNRIQWCRANKRGFLVIKHKLTHIESERLRSLPVNWIDFTTEARRLYPNGQIAAHVLGGVFKQQEGASGVERGMNVSLHGQGGSERLLTDVKRRGIDSHTESAAVAGKALTLTIDERIQFVAEREIAAAVAKHHCVSGTVVVMNPYNGEILALANYPTYDPNVAPKRGDDPKPRYDLGVSVPFEPGSVFKVFTLSAALETTNLRPESLIQTGNGALSLPGRVVHDTHAHGTLTFAEVLEQSSNIGAILIGTRVGREGMNEYVRRFGFGSRAGIPLPAESGGLLRKLDHWGTTSLASIAMGQEVSATSLQLARAAAVIANGGLLVKPKLVLKEGDKLTPTETPVRILKPETAITMRQLMEGVVLRGTGHLCCRLDGYTSGGKTGSAQIFDRASKHYTHTYNASFMGFAPVTNPALVVMVTLNGTVGNAGFGGPSAGPVFNVVMTEALRILDVPKDLPETVPQDKNVQVAEVDQNDLAIAGLSDGTNILEDDPTAKPSAEMIAAATPEPNADGLVIPSLLAMNTAPATPDFRGKTVREVIQESSESGVPISLEGRGVARAQWPKPGAPLPQGAKVRVRFRR